MRVAPRRTFGRSMLAPSYALVERVQGRQQRLVYVVGAATAERARLAADLRQIAHNVREVAVLHEVSETEIRHQRSVVLLVESDHANICSPDALKAFREHDAATAVLLASRSGSRTMHQLADLVRSGLDGLSVLELESFQEIRGAVARHLRFSIPRSLTDAVIPRADSSVINADSSVINIVGLCFRLGFARHAAEDIASWLQWDRKTIWRHLNQSQLRPIHDLLELGRLAHAAVRFDETFTPIGGIAENLQFDAASLRRLCKRETRMTPKQLRQHGALKTLVETVHLHRDGALGANRNTAQSGAPHCLNCPAALSPSTREYSKVVRA